MKKLLAMVLALVMTLSLAVSANAFKDDKSISDDYAEAVAVLNGMGVFKGYEDGSFQPKGNITRAEVSAIVYRVYTQDVKDAKASMYATYNKFSDMAGAGWAQGYIGYCANAELVKGYPDGTFKPSGKVTGYEVLAMILRAVGYDKNGEFSGADWALHVAQTAQQAGVLKNVKGIDLNAPATRELVAELLFRAIADASTVNYTPAFGYVTDKVLKLDESTLGYKNFKLVGKADSDKWGRPGTTWTYNVGDKETFVGDKAVASYTVKVDECDIAKDLGISKSATIDSAYIDGVKTNVTNASVTSDRNGKIDALNTTSLVGAQGRLTEVYNMGDAGYRLVEINTYLGVVKTVTAATTDRNGHTTAAKIGVALYLDNTNTANPTTAVYSYETTGFTVGQYVLVNATLDGKVVIRNVEAATVTPMGLIKTWTPAYGTVAATTTVAETKYNDADKFFLNNFKLGNLTAGQKNTISYDTIVDAYGNLIALVKSNVNYLVIEKIEWKHDNSVIGNGKALADVVLATGEKLTGVTVASVNSAVTSNTGDSLGTVGTAYVSDSYVNNGDAKTGARYYGHIFTYSVNADGTYSLNKHCAEDAAASQPTHNDAAVSFSQYKTATIGGQYNRVVANNNTKFLVLNKTGDTYAYTVYNGINELPSMTVAAKGLCYLSDGTYATLVVIKNYELASSTFVAYAARQNGFATGYNPVKYAYTVTKLGSTEATTLYSTTQFQIDKDGFYFFKLDANGNIITANSYEILQAYAKPGATLDNFGFYTTSTSTPATPTAVDGLYYDRGLVKAFDGDSLVSGTETQTFYDYRVNSTTEYYVVTKTIYSNGTENTEITKGDINSVSVGDRVIVAYKSDNNALTENVASYIYVLKTVDNGSNPEITTGTVEFKVQFVDQYGVVKSDVLDLGVQKNSTTGTFSFDLRTVLDHHGWQGDFTWNATTVALVGQLNSTKAETYTVNAGETTTVIFTVIK